MNSYWKYSLFLRKEELGSSSGSEGVKNRVRTWEERLSSETPALENRKLAAKDLRRDCRVKACTSGDRGGSSRLCKSRWAASGNKDAGATLCVLSGLSRFGRVWLCDSRLSGREPTRLLCPWDSPGRNTGVGCQRHRHNLIRAKIQAEAFREICCPNSLKTVSHALVSSELQSQVSPPHPKTQPSVCLRRWRMSCDRLLPGPWHGNSQNPLPRLLGEGHSPRRQVNQRSEHTGLQGCQLALLRRLQGCQLALLRPEISHTPWAKPPVLWQFSQGFLLK